MTRHFYLNPTLDQPQESVYSIIQKASVQMLDKIEDTCTNLILDAAREKGITDLILLDKKAIVEVFERQIPQKPIELFGRAHCPCCDTIASIAQNFCYKCGQKLDWKVKTEDECNS